MISIKFTLRFLLIAVLIISLALAFFVRRRSVAMQQRIAVLGLIQPSLDTNQRKANVYYDFEVPRFHAMNRGHFIVHENPHPLCYWLGMDFMHDVALVEFERSPDATQLDQLAAFPGLKEVIFHGSPQNAGSLKSLACAQSVEKLTLNLGHLSGSVDFQHVSKLQKLNELVLKNGILTEIDLANVSQCHAIETLRLLNIDINSKDLETFPEFKFVKNFFWRNHLQSVGDEDICFVEKFPSVQKIAFAGQFPITDSAFQSFAELDYLQELSLHGTMINGRSAGRLKSLRRLKVLELGAGPLNDAGLEQIALLSNLEHLEVGSTEVSDAGMQYLAKLKKLRHLSIRDTQVTDSGLSQLQPLQRISFLRLKNSRVTTKGITAFQLKHPDCVIEK